MNERPPTLALDAVAREAPPAPRRPAPLVGGIQAVGGVGTPRHSKPEVGGVHTISGPGSGATTEASHRFLINPARLRRTVQRTRNRRCARGYHHRPAPPTVACHLSVRLQWWRWRTHACSAIQRPPRNRLCRAAGGAPLGGRRRRRFGGVRFAPQAAYGLRELTRARGLREAQRWARRRAMRRHRCHHWRQCTRHALP